MRFTKKNHRIVADDEIEMEEIPEIDDVEEVAEDISIDPAATDLLFEAEDVAELVAEITGSSVDVVADSDQVVFTVDGIEYTIQPDGDEEILEACRRPLANKSKIAASRRKELRNRVTGSKNRVAASTRVTNKKTTR